MKKLFIILMMLVGIYSCENFEITHPDYDYTSGFFPYQFPVRTLVLGDYIYDNSNDNAHKFVISVAMGGVYENKKDRNFEFEVDNSLCENILFSSDGDPIIAMPSSYYTLSSSNKIVIPRGKFNGGVEVQLTDAFFNDPLAIKLGYVVPLRLKSSADVDTILVGKSGSVSADPRVAGQWDVAPKNFTMFAVKYINEFHGTYFHLGESKVKDSAGAEVENTNYTASYIEGNPTSKLITSGRYQVELSTSLKSSILTGEINMVLKFNGNTCTIEGAPGSSLSISGAGEFKSKAYNWGNKDRDGIVLNYTVSDGTNTYTASDILVSRDRAVVMEVYNPVVN